MSFKLGYEVRCETRPADLIADHTQTVDKLDSSTATDTVGTSTLSRLIAALPRGLTNAPPTRRPPPPPPPPHPSGKHPLAALPPEKAVLNARPYARISGARKVPILASANGIPFLRLTKPQPAALSRVLRQKLARRNLRFHDKIELGNYWLPLAKQEDEWDALLTEQLMQKEDNIEWAKAVSDAERQLGAQHAEWMANDKEITRKMQRIVDIETELALKEGQAIVRGRRKAPIRVLRP